MGTQSARGEQHVKTSDQKAALWKDSELKKGNCGKKVIQRKVVWEDNGSLESFARNSRPEERTEKDMEDEREGGGQEQQLKGDGGWSKYEIQLGKRFGTGEVEGRMITLGSTDNATEEKAIGGQRQEKNGDVEWDEVILG